MAESLKVWLFVVWILRFNLIHAFLLISVMTHILSWLHLLNIIYSVTWNKANLCIAAVTKKHRASKMWVGREKERREVWRTVIVSWIYCTCSAVKHVSGVLRYRVRRRLLFLLRMLVQSDKAEAGNAWLSAESFRTASPCRSYLLNLTMWQS